MYLSWALLGAYSVYSLHLTDEYIDWHQASVFILSISD